jgi:CRISPR-associated protein Cas5 subtype I-C
MPYGIKLAVSGDHACFTRPEMKVERVSYDVITPSAARGILEAIHWKPAIRWVIEAIHVLKPIRFQSIRRNEVRLKVKASTTLGTLSRSARVRRKTSWASSRPRTPDTSVETVRRDRTASLQARSSARADKASINPARW